MSFHQMQQFNNYTTLQEFILLFQNLFSNGNAFHVSKRSGNFFNDMLGFMTFYQCFTYQYLVPGKKHSRKGLNLTDSVNIKLTSIIQFKFEL